MMDIGIDGEIGFREYSGTVIIEQSPGGTGAAAEQLALASRLIIKGRCASACAWAAAIARNACYDPGAVFVFHGSHDPGTGHSMPAATKYWIDRMPRTLQARLAPLLLTADTVTVGPRDIPIAPCARGKAVR